MSAAPTGEPIITTMSVDQDRVTEDPPFIVDRTDNTKVSAYGLWQLQKKKRDLRQEYLDHWQASAGLTGTGRPVDAIISPVAQYAAPPHGMNKYLAHFRMFYFLPDCFPQIGELYRNLERP